MDSMIVKYHLILRVHVYNSPEVLNETRGMTVWALFEKGTKYFEPSRAAYFSSEITTLPKCRALCK